MRVYDEIYILYFQERRRVYIAGGRGERSLIVIRNLIRLRYNKVASKTHDGFYWPRNSNTINRDSCSKTAAE